MFVWSPRDCLSSWNRVKSAESDSSLGRDSAQLHVKALIIYPNHPGSLANSLPLSSLSAPLTVGQDAAPVCRQPFKFPFVKPFYTPSPSCQTSRPVCLGTTLLRNVHPLHFIKPSSLPYLWHLETIGIYYGEQEFKLTTAVVLHEEGSNCQLLIASFQASKWWVVDAKDIDFECIVELLKSGL